MAQSRGGVRFWGEWVSEVERNVRENIRGFVGGFFPGFSRMEKSPLPGKRPSITLTIKSFSIHN